MKTIKEDVTNEIIINKSRFITILTYIENKENIENKLSYYKNKYKDATHYCTAYILDNYEKCDDDKEPSGTAGIPILNTLKNNNLTNILCIVIRYFGGVKLGSGGLIRAYSNSTSEAIKKAEIVDLIDGYLVEITFDYDNTKVIDNILKDVIIGKKFSTNICYTFKISKDKYEEIENILKLKTKTIKKEPIQIVV